MSQEYVDSSASTVLPDDYYDSDYDNEYYDDEYYDDRNNRSPVLSLDSSSESEIEEQVGRSEESEMDEEQQQQGEEEEGEEGLSEELFDSEDLEEIARRQSSLGIAPDGRGSEEVILRFAPTTAGKLELGVEFLDRDEVFPVKNIVVDNSPSNTEATDGYFSYSEDQTLYINGTTRTSRVFTNSQGAAFMREHEIPHVLVPHPAEAHLEDPRELASTALHPLLTKLQEASVFTRIKKKAQSLVKGDKRTAITFLDLTTKQEQLTESEVLAQFIPQSMHTRAQRKMLINFMNKIIMDNSEDSRQLAAMFDRFMKDEWRTAPSALSFAQLNTLLDDMADELYDKISYFMKPSALGYLSAKELRNLTVFVAWMRVVAYVRDRLGYQTLQAEDLDRLSYELLDTEYDDQSASDVLGGLKDKLTKNYRPKVRKTLSEIEVAKRTRFVLNRSPKTESNKIKETFEAITEFKAIQFFADKADTTEAVLEAGDWNYVASDFINTLGLFDEEQLKTLEQEPSSSLRELPRDALNNLIKLTMGIYPFESIQWHMTFDDVPKGGYSSRLIQSDSGRLEYYINPSGASARQLADRLRSRHQARLSPAEREQEDTLVVLGAYGGDADASALQSLSQFVSHQLKMERDVFSPEAKSKLLLKAFKEDMTIADFQNNPREQAFFRAIVATVRLRNEQLVAQRNSAVVTKEDWQEVVAVALPTIGGASAQLLGTSYSQSGRADSFSFEAIWGDVSRDNEELRSYLLRAFFGFTLQSTDQLLTRNQRKAIRAFFKAIQHHPVGAAASPEGYNDDGAGLDQDYLNSLSKRDVFFLMSGVWRLWFQINRTEMVLYSTPNSNAKGNDPFVLPPDQNVGFEVYIVIRRLYDYFNNNDSQYDKDVNDYVELESDYQQLPPSARDLAGLPPPEYQSLPKKALDKNSQYGRFEPVPVYGTLPDSLEEPATNYGALPTNIEELEQGYGDTGDYGLLPNPDEYNDNPNYVGSRLLPEKDSDYGEIPEF